MANNDSGYYVRNNTIYVQGSVNGKFVRKSTRKKATKANLSWIKKNSESVLLQLVDKSINKKEDYTLEEFGYHSLKINAHNRKGSTNQGYLNDFKLHILPAFRLYQLTDIRPTDLKQWQGNLHKRGISGKRINSIRTVFRGILQDAYIDELIDYNPFDRVKRAKMMKPEIHPFSLEEVELLIKEADGWFKNFLILAFFTGMRTGELFGLKWEDINFKSRYLHIQRGVRKGVIDSTKTEKSRQIDMLPVVERALRNQFLDTGLKGTFVFLTQYGGNYRESDSIKKSRWAPLLKQCMLDYRILYHTRHTFASIMLQQGEEIAWVSMMLGHADIHTTLTKYARFIPRRDKKRAEFLENLDVDLKFG